MKVVNKQAGRDELARALLSFKWPTCPRL